MTDAIDTLRRRLERGHVVLDGATGTELARRGVDCPPPLWSATALLTAPDVVQAIHRDYVAAGAEIVVANTFRTNPRTLREANRFADGSALNTLAVSLARRAVGRRNVWVAASVAPVADCYHPEWVPPEVVLHDEHEKMMIWLERAEPDLVWIETINSAVEARAVTKAAADRQLPFVVSFVVQENGDLLSGEPLEDAILAVERHGPLAIGLNCVPPRGLTELLPRLRRATARPLIAYAHIGNVEPIRGWSYAEDSSPQEYAAHARAWLERGVAIVGGCCGTTPAHIEALRTAFEDVER